MQGLISILIIGNFLTLLAHAQMVPDKGICPLHRARFGLGRRWGEPAPDAPGPWHQTPRACDAGLAHGAEMQQDDCGCCWLTSRAAVSLRRLSGVRC
eukprot:3410887-Rhodomonas_salina.1